MDHLSLGLSGSVGLPSLGGDGGDGFPATDDITSPQSASRRLAYQSSRTLIYHHKDKGIKIPLGGSLDDQQPHQWQVDRVRHELTISRRLPPSCKRREVLGIQPFHGHPVALYFKWTNGSTLTEWIAQESSSNENRGCHTNSLVDPTSITASPAPRASDDVNVRLRAAMAVAKTLSDFHEAGVAYNNLTPENVVLDMFQGEFVATFIDLSEAVIFKNHDRGNQGSPNSAEEAAAVERQMKQDDLKSLGAVLLRLFRGFQVANTYESIDGHSRTNALAFQEGDTSPESWREEARRKRNKQTEASEGLPVYLGALISTLLLNGREVKTANSPTSSVHYESAKDVYLDLKTLLENQNQCYHKKDLDEWMLKSKLKLNADFLYGRQVQMSMLMHLLHNVFGSGNEPSIATISGHPGTGKSTLAYQIKKPVLDRDGFFIDGKFHKSECPDTVLSNALNNFLGSIIEKRSNPDHLITSLRWRISDAIGAGSNLLMDAIPNLRKLMSEETMATQTSSEHITLRSGKTQTQSSSHRLKFMFCKLIGAVASKAHPLILFLDDLQWADDITLDVLRMILTDPDVNHFLLLGAYRDNEVSLSHPLMEKLNDLKEHGTNAVTINIGPIEKECVNSLISEALCLPPNLCRPLSNVIHTKTGGIIMFLLRFLMSLNDEGLLWFSLSSHRWEFDLEKIRIKEISADVVQHMTLNMTRLDKTMQMGLKTASCLGSNFDAEMLQSAKKDNDFDLDTFLQKCVDEGYLVSTDGYKQLAWVHDQVHQAAYELIPIANRESFHHFLGSRLLTKSSSSEIAKMLFCIVDNMNRGVELVECDEQKLELASLNLRAGERARSFSAFHTASRYFLTGLSLVDNDSWEENYSLKLRLYDAASEALYVTGDFSRLESLVEKPLKFAKCFDDKLYIYNYLVRSYAASGQMEEGIATCFRVLGQLGESIPSTFCPETLHAETVRIREMMQGMTDDQLLSLPLMTDTSKMAAMQFLNHLLFQAYFSKPELSPVISFRMVEMSIEHGVCNITSFAFAVFGAFLVSAISDNEGGYRMGRIAMELMKRMNAIEVIPRLYIMVYSMINIWKEPFQASLSKNMEAFNIGAHRGDMEFAIMCLFQYVNMSIFGCGESFNGLIKNIQAYSKRALQCQQYVLGRHFVVAHQLIFDFMGVQENAYSLYFIGMTEQSCFDTSVRNNQSAFCRYICQKRKNVAFWTGDMDFAVQMYESSKQFPLGVNGRLVSDLVSTFIDGLIAFYFARKQRSNKAKWTAIGEDIMAELEKWEEGSTWNFRNKRLLLEAEFNFLKGNHQMTMHCYNESIKAAHSHRFYHEEGLAYEKAATYLLHEKDHNGAIGYFMNAKKCYETWGAQTLVVRVDRTIEVLLPLCADT